MGLCSKSELSSIETSSRNASKLLIDRLLSRLGITLDSVEHLLQPDEYSHWITRNTILDLITTRQLIAAQFKICNELRKKSSDKLHLQFLYIALSYVYESNKNFDYALSFCEKAMYCSITKEMLKNIEAQPLSCSEYFILIEYCKLRCIKEKNITENISGFYDKILISFRTYLGETSDYCKLLPKYTETYILIHSYQKDSLAFSESELALISESFFIQKKYNKGYYLYDLLISLKSICAKSSLLSSLFNNNKITYWSDLIKKIHTTFGLTPLSGELSWFLDEPNCFLIGTTIKKRRKALNYTQKDLATGFCSEKTVYRIEQNLSKCNLPLLHAILNKLHYTPGMAISASSSYNYCILEHNILLSKLIGEKRKYAEIFNYVCSPDFLETPSADKNLFTPRQLAVINYLHQKTSKQVFYNKLINLLEKTISPQAATSPETPLSSEEIMILLDIVLFDLDSVSISNKIISKLKKTLPLLLISNYSNLYIILNFFTIITEENFNDLKFTAALKKFMPIMLKKEDLTYIFDTTSILAYSPNIDKEEQHFLSEISKLSFCFCSNKLFATKLPAATSKPIIEPSYDSK